MIKKIHLVILCGDELPTTAFTDLATAKKWIKGLPRWCDSRLASVPVNDKVKEILND